MKVFYLLKQGLLVLLVFSALIVKAQTGSVSGKVLDETGQPLPGASIYIKGTSRSTSTDGNGNFKLAGLTNGTLTLSASFIGYQTLDKAVAVTANATVNFQLVPDAQKLNEVVVIGYGTAEKKNLTGSITTVSSKDFQKGTITTPEQLIQGKVAGVNIISGGGAPGGGSTIRVRGGASLNASNDPLIVVDGVPFSGNGIGNAPSPLSLINPNDIETFTVLKDANATAIYGSRASNGVILITTKKGISGAPQINFSTNNSIATVAKKVDVLSADEVRAFVNANGNATQKALLGTASTDWQDEIYRNAFSTDNNLSIAGSFKGVPYRVSAGYLDQQGVVIKSELKRATGAFSIAPKLFQDHLKIELNLKGSLTDSQYPNDGAIGAAIQFDPTQPVNANNKFGNYFEWITSAGVPNPNAPRNPLALIEQQDNHGNAARSFGNVKLDYSFHFLPELHAVVNLGYDYSKGYGRTIVPTFAAQSFSTEGSFSRRLNTEMNKFSEAYLTYAKTIGQSRFDVTGGYGYYDDKITNYNFASYRGTGVLLTTPVFPFSIEQNKLLSYYGRFNYTLAEKYILSATMRADASSKFAENNRWGYFPSVGFTWRIIGEDFLKDSKVLSDLKLRLTYGETGNKDGNDIGNYNYLSKYYANTNNGQYQVGNTFYNYYSAAGYDPDLRWETTTTYNAGLDYGFLKGRLYGSVDIYYKKTKDLLSKVTIPVGTNFSNELVTNVGNMDVRGAEVSLNYVAIKTENTTWDIGVNGAYNKRKVTNLTLNPNSGFKIDAGDITGGTGIHLKYNAVNQLPGSFFVYKQVYNGDGKPLEGVYQDLNGDGTVTPADQYFFKSPDPVVTLGFNTSFTYKKWTASTVLRANLGNYIYDNISSNFGIRTNVLSTQGILNNSTSDLYNTNFSGLSGVQYLSDYYIRNASFLKMDNVGLSYNVGKLSKNGNTTMRISANCQNVFVVSKYKGIDPESQSGIDYNLYPRPRTYTLGLNVGF